MNANRQGRTTRRELLGLAFAGIAGSTLPLAARAAHVVRPWPAGRAVPELNLTDLDGKAWRLAALQGRALVVNFWATWCEPCRAEMPSLAALAKRHERSGLTVLAVNYREPEATIRRFLETTPLVLPILLDRDGEAASAWTSRMFPSTVLIDRSGTPRSTVVGEIDWLGGAARELIEPLLARPRSV